MLAKQAGIQPFRNQVYAVITHGSIDWVYRINDHYGYRTSDVEWIGLEKRTVELADVIIAPSIYLLKEYKKYGWQLPTRVYQHPYPVSRAVKYTARDGRSKIEELVFFGRLEVRKGLWIFCEAVDRLIHLYPDLRITFLGRVTDFSGISSGLQVVSRCAAWPTRVRLFSDFDQNEALAYLRQAGILAVMPSIKDNSPCVVYECLEHSIPFVATKGSGAEELLHRECWDDILVEPNVNDLVDKLISILDNGAAYGKPSFDTKDNLRVWSQWHGYVSANLEQFKQEKVTSGLNIASTLPQAAVLMVVLDDGRCSLSLLIENISTHVARYGMRAGYVILSARRGIVFDLLSDVLGYEGENGQPPIVVLDPDSVEECREIISSSTHVLFSNADAEVLTPLFIYATGKLGEVGKTIVTCVGAERIDKREAAVIRDIPCGDLPGLGELGEPIGGPVWAMSGTEMRDIVAMLPLYDLESDNIASASLLGILRCLPHAVERSRYICFLRSEPSSHQRGDKRRSLGLCHMRVALREQMV